MSKHPKQATDTAIALLGVKDHEEGGENWPMEVGLRVPNVVWKDNASARNATPSRKLVGNKYPDSFPLLPSRRQRTAVDAIHRFSLPCH